MLFQLHSSASQLKTELHRLVNASPETVTELGGVVNEGEGQASRLVQCALQELGERSGFVTGETSLTYEVLQQIVEGLAIEHGYYHQTNSS